MRSLILLIVIGLNVVPNFSSGATNRVEEFWPNGNFRRAFDQRNDVRHGEYRTWREDGRPYELRHYVHGRESGLQQSWDEQGALYLNYEVRDGRRYGFVNAYPCAPASMTRTTADGGRR